MFNFLSGGIIESIGKIADELITSDEERAEKENEKLKTNLNYKVEMAALGIEGKKLDYGLVQNETDNVTNRWTSDNQGNFLTKSIRPITLLYLLGLITIMIFGAMFKIEIPSQYLDLVQILSLTVFGAFFGGKTFERIKSRTKE